MCAAWIPLDNTSTGRPFTVSPFRLFHDSKNPTTTMSHFQARWTYARLNAAWAGVKETAHPQRGKAFRVTNSCRCQRSEVRRGPANVGPGRLKTAESRGLEKPGLVIDESRLCSNSALFERRRRLPHCRRWCTCPSVQRSDNTVQWLFGFWGIPTTA